MRFSARRTLQAWPDMRMQRLPTFMVYTSCAASFYSLCAFRYPGQSNPTHSDELIMAIANQASTVHKTSVANYVATNPLERDQTQSRRLHEPAQILSSTDPMTGREIGDLTAHPYLVDGNVTIYFETEATRKAFMEMPVDHPFHLVDNPTDEGYDEG
jgi:hypothetical protein